MKSWLAEDLFVLFGILAVGAALGRVSVRGISFGSAGVLLAAMVAGHFGLAIPGEVKELGLVLFVYAVGLQAGPRFFRTFSRRALQWGVIGLGSITVGALATLAAFRLLGLSREVAVGMFTGALTCTPALAGAVDALERASSQHAADASVGYGIAYPFSMLGVVLLVSLLPRLLRRDVAAEERRSAAELAEEAPPLAMRTFRVTNPNCEGLSLGDLTGRHVGGVVFSRVRRGDDVLAVRPDVVLRVGDHVRAVGPAADLDRLTLVLGQEEDVPMDLNPRIQWAEAVLTEPALAGRTLGDLHAWKGQGVAVTRIRRAGLEIAPNGRTMLEMGDHLVFVGEMEEVRAFERRIQPGHGRGDETNMVPFLVTLVLGVALGLVPLPLPRGLSVELGAAGGAFLVSLVVGHFGRVGPLRLHVPPAAKNLSRELGLMLFLAGVGTSAGGRLVEVLRAEGPSLVAAGAAITVVTVLTGLLLTHVAWRMNLLATMGALPAIMTNPPGLGAAVSRTSTDVPALAYASVYPVALIGKILLAQVLVEVLSLLA